MRDEGKTKSKKPVQVIPPPSALIPWTADHYFSAFESSSANFWAFAKSSLPS